MFRFQSLVIESGCGCIAVTSHPPTCPGEYQLSPQYKVHAPDPSFPPFWMMTLLTSFCGAGVLQTSRGGISKKSPLFLDMSFPGQSLQNSGRCIKTVVQASITWSSSECHHTWSTRNPDNYCYPRKTVAKCKRTQHYHGPYRVINITLMCNQYLFYWLTMQVFP